MRDPESGWFQLNTLEFFLLWSAISPSGPPLVLGVPHFGRTRQARAELTEYVSQALADRELGTVAEPARDLSAVMRTLVDHEVALDVRVYGQGEPLLGFAARGGRGAAAVARVGDEVRVGPAGRDGLAASLLGSLTPLPAGSGRPANVGVADYERACAEGERDGVSGFLAALRATGMRPPEASTLAAALAGRQGGGQLGASGVDRGRVVRGPSTVNWVDAPDGRYALRRNGTWITITPVDLPRLTTMAEEMLEDIASH